MNFLHPIISDELLAAVIDGVVGRSCGIHGVEHWKRVERNGLYLAGFSGADKKVVSLFALFHDARRINDCCDPGHGERGARLAEDLFERGLLPIAAEQLQALVKACEGHTDEFYTDNATIGSCWDADRLDLTRIGIAPDPELLNTDKAKELAKTPNFEALLRDGAE